MNDREDIYATVRRYYDRNTEREWQRLARHRFELPVTLHFLDKFVTPGSTVLDIGGGPGRYAQELTRAGHTVDLFDLSPESVELARRMEAETGIRIRSHHVGNATDLSRFESAAYDVVLNLGPLYHLVREGDRQEALTESIRVLKPGGVLAAGFLSSFAHVYDFLNKDPALITEAPGLAERCRASRAYRESDGEHFTDGFLIEPFEIEPLMSGFPLQKLAMIGAEGVLAQSERAVCQKDEQVTQAWIAFCKEVADTREAVASSIHVTWFGRKLDA